MKTCSTCQIEKPLDDFAPMKASKDGKAARCRACYKIWWDDWYHNRGGKEANRERNRARKPNPEATLRKRLAKYGLSSAEFNLLIAANGTKCAICLTNDYEVIDHDHESGKVRGLLCHYCNRALGGFKDNADILRRAAHYIESKK